MKMSILRTLVFLFWLLPLCLNAQVSINEDGSDPAPTAVLDLKSTGKGMLVPRMTDTQRDAIVDPATGLLVFVNSDSSFYYFDGTAWLRVAPAPDREALAGAAGFPDSVMYTASLMDLPAGVEVVGDYAYVLRENAGASSFVVYDVSDPANITQLANYDPVLMASLTAMDARPSIAAISDGNRVELLSLSSPSNPTMQDDYSDGLGTKYYLKFYNDDILFTHSSFFGGQLEIREFSTSTIKILSLGSHPVDIAFSGNYAFVTNTGNDKLEVIDFSDIANASVVHSVSLGSDPVSVSVSGTYAYVANNGNDLLEIIDISDPLTASVVHSVSLGSDPRQVRTNANYAFVLDQTNSLFQIIDISDPTAAQLLESLNIGGSPSYFDIEGSYAYVANGSTGSYELQVLSIPSGNGFLPVYNLDGNITGYYNQTEIVQKIDQFDLSGNNLQISITGDGEAPKTVNLSPYLDNTDAQSLSLNANTLSLTNGGSVDLSPYLDNTDAQALSLNSNTLNLTNGGSVDLSPYLDNTDAQTLSLSNSNLTITGGNTVDLSSLAVDEHWAVSSGTNIANTNEGNVGIGSMAPTQNRWQLTVRDTANCMFGTDSIDVSELAAVFTRNLNQNNTGVGIGFQSSSSVNVIGAAIVHERTNNNSRGKLHFATKANGTTSPEDIPIRMTLDEQGRLGIGITSPAEKLHVEGAIRMVDGNQQAGHIPVSDANGTMTWTDPATIISSDDGDWTINGNNQFSATSGNVGIGTSSPSEKLHVAGAIRMVDGNQQAGHIPVSDANGTMTWSAPGELIEDWTIDSLFGAAPTNGTPLQDASQESGPSAVSPSPAQETWQSFTAERSGNLVQVDVNHNGDPIGSGTLKIYEGEGVSGPLLHEQPVSGTASLWASYQLTTGVAVTAGNQYTASFSSGDSYQLQLSGANPYPGGRMGGNGISSAWDARFKTFVIPKTQVFGVDPVSGSVSLADGRIFIDENGDTGIGAASPGSRLHVTDGFATAGQFVATIENTGNAGWSNGLQIKAGQNSQSANNRFISFSRPDGTEIGAVRQISSSSVDYNTTSDERLKTNIQPTAKGLSDLMQIQVTDYVYRDDPGKPQTGFIAQQVYEHYPNAVTPGGVDLKTNPWMMDYGKMTPLLVKAVQEQQEMIGALQAENTTLQARLDKMDSLKARLAKIEATLEIQAKMDATLPEDQPVKE